MSAIKGSTAALLGRKAAAASEAHVAQAARAVLERGSAVDAVVAGVLAAVAESPTVFFGPVQIIVGGGGAGLVAMDGRARQPGRGVQRPRGFLADEPVPAPARVGVSALPATLAAAVASIGTMTLLRVAGPAIASAQVHSPERAAVIESFARRGAQALSENAIAGELLAAAGRAAKGLLTPEDLAEVRPEVMRFDERRIGRGGILSVPWCAFACESDSADAGSYRDASSTHVVAAVDAHGMVAVACYEAPFEGLAVPSLGLVLPLRATPVMRGQPRVSPGEALAAAAPIALRARRGVVDVAIGIAAATDAERSLQSVAERLDALPTVSEAIAEVRSGRAVALVRTSDLARVIASA
jgi:hypothetical protein